MSNKELAFLLGRISLGINCVAHGLIHLPKISAFSAGLVKKFQDTLIGVMLLFLLINGFTETKYSVDYLMKKRG